MIYILYILTVIYMIALPLSWKEIEGVLVNRDGKKEVSYEAIRIKHSVKHWILWGLITLTPIFNTCGAIAVSVMAILEFNDPWGSFKYRMLFGFTRHSEYYKFHKPNKIQSICTSIHNFLTKKI